MTSGEASQLRIDEFTLSTDGEGCQFQSLCEDLLQVLAFLLGYRVESRDA